MQSDTLQYNSKNKIIYFRDLTTVTDKDGGVAIYKNGFIIPINSIRHLLKGKSKLRNIKSKGMNMTSMMPAKSTGQKEVWL
ncbi:MAG: hypothetical protein U5K54_02130 [Cytophagales bacterium]|nr:hypothetical protein [Cytophagales bacterium]